jgi:hypothetical protein
LRRRDDFSYGSKPPGVRDSWPERSALELSPQPVDQVLEPVLELLLRPADLHVFLDLGERGELIR